MFINCRLLIIWMTQCLKESGALYICKTNSSNAELSVTKRRIVGSSSAHSTNSLLFAFTCARFSWKVTQVI
ncbi:hypothetical protein X975_22976, partial [Stegodyphus mimosarum]